MKKVWIAAAASCVAAAAFGGALLVGCGSGSSQPVEKCVVGWWQDPQPGGCLCPAEPECAAGDCQAFGTKGLLADQRYFDGHIAVSQKAHTMSTNGQLSSGTWSVNGGTITIKQPNIPDFNTTVACNGGQLTFGFEQDQRPPANLATALDSATADGGTSWKAYPVSP